ncbi:MAG: hypothetical protein WAM95_19080 [Bacillus sp. (in: firmicutes)]
MEAIIGIITSLISSIIFVYLISLYYFDTLHYFELVDFLFIWGILVLPVFLIGGFIAMFVVPSFQKLFESKTYFTSLIVIIFLGVICNFYALLHFIKNGWDDGVMEYLILGISGSLLYFHIWLFLGKLTIKLRINLLRQS